MSFEPDSRGNSVFCRVICPDRGAIPENTMGINELQAGQVRRAIARFRDYASDLLNADMNTFDDRLNLFLTFCEADPTISRVHHQLLGVPGVDLHGWYAAAQQKRELKFPTVLDQRLSLMYRVLLAVRSEEIRFLDFAITVLPSTNSQIDSYISSFNEAIVRPMVRELEYRLEDLAAELPSDDAQPVGMSVFQVITNTGTFVQQVAPGAQGSVMTTSVDTRALRQVVDLLRDAVSQAPLDSAARQDATDVVNAIAEEAQSPTPRGGVLKGLITALPRIADVAKIVDVLNAMLGT